MKSDRPLVSFCLTCYNQADYIRAALQGALNQDYENLEVVVCDDNSTDGSVEIIKQEVERYKDSGGSHAVICQFNDRNLSTLKNYEQAFRLAHGDVLVTCGGDDISYPNRASRIVELWVSDGRRAKFIIHQRVEIDLAGRVIGLGGLMDARKFLGAGVAYSREVVERFGVLPELRGAYEDYIFPIRALMCGPALVIDEPLIQYRVGSGVCTSGEFRERRSRVLRHKRLSHQVAMRELAENKDKFDSVFWNEAKENAGWSFKHFRAEDMVINGRTFLVRLIGYMRMTEKYGWGRGGVKFAEYFPLLFPDWLRPLTDIVLYRPLLKLLSVCRKLHR